MIQRRFISNASHELSTPLTSISSQLEVTLHKDRDIEEYKQVMLSIREDVKQMQQLTKSLLEIAKTGSQGTIELVEVRIDEVMFKVMGDVQKISPDYKVELHFRRYPGRRQGVPGVWQQRSAVQRHQEFCRERMQVFAGSYITWVDLSFQSGQIIIRVKNQGDVIAEEEIEHIFQPFYRTNTASTRTKGFGLGLALTTKRIIGLHKRAINVQSDIVSGTVFAIVLPSVKAFSR